MKVTTKKWDASEHLDNPKLIYEYLKASFAEGDSSNKASEQYYRTTLKQFQINEAYDELAVMAKNLNQQALNSAPILRLHENYLNDKFNTGFIVRCQTVIIALFLRRMPECSQDL